MSYLTRHQQTQQARDDTKSQITAYSQKTAKSSSTAKDPQKREQDKQDLLEKMKQNDEKHKLMMIENQRRRKEQEKKLKKLEEEKRKKEQQLLGQRKQDKEDAYIKYLRKNSKNVIENLKAEKPQQNQYAKQAPQKKEVEKVQTQYKYDKNAFEALNVETYTKKKPSNNANTFRNEFEKSWAEDEFQVMRKSELLDSLDLETQPRQRPPTGKKVQKPSHQIEELIGYEEAASEDEDELWNQTLKNGRLEAASKPKQQPKQSMDWAKQQLSEADDVLSKPGGKQTQNNVPPQVPKKDSVSQQNTVQAPPKPVVVNTNIKATQNIQRHKSQPKKPPQQQVVQRKMSPNTLATRDAEFDQQQFLREDMMHINEEEYKLQQELVALNMNTNQKIAEINQKFGIRTNLVSSQQVRNPDAKVVAHSTENQIEASILRIDQMLKQPKQQVVYQPPPTYMPPFVPPQVPPQPQKVNIEFQRNAQMALQQHQQIQQVTVAQQPQFPAFPSYVLHQDLNSFVQETSTYKEKTEIPKEETLNEEIEIQKDDHSAVSDSRAFKITKRKLNARDKPKCYAEAAQAKIKAPIIEETHEPDEPPNEGKILFSRNAQLLFD